MFFKRKKPSPPENKARNSNELAVVAMLGAIEKQEEDDKLVRAKITGKEITVNLIEMIKDKRGIRIEIALGILGSLAGFSTSYAVVHEMSRGALKAEMPEVMIVEMKSGEKFMFGEYINRKLAGGELIGDQSLSLWSLIAGKAEQLGGSPKLDLNELFSRVAKSAGNPEFGTLSVPELHHPGASPQEIVKGMFAKFLPILERYELPVDQYFLAFALSGQEMMEIGKDCLTSDISVQIFMECAVPASKLDPRSYLAA
ncbi:MAG: hypothetical protein ACU0CA_12525 [Paracoccaceae bacterium]